MTRGASVAAAFSGALLLLPADRAASPEEPFEKARDGFECLLGRSEGKLVVPLLFLPSPLAAFGATHTD